MGMSFDKAVDRLEDLHFEQDDWEYEKLTEDCLLNKEALRLAIDTMRKYQKIKNIICKWEDGLYDDEGVSHVEVLDMISDEVNGDGNDD